VSQSTINFFHSAKSFGRKIAAICLAATMLVGLSNPSAQTLHSDDLSLNETRVFFDQAFSLSKERGVDLRRWDGTEHFCFIWQDRRSSLRSFAPKTINQISAAYSLAFTHSHVQNISQCNQDRTSIYVLVGIFPGTDKLSALLEDLVGTRPPEGIIKTFPVLGVSITLPGPRNRDFIFVATKQDRNAPDLIDSKAIFLEELLHSLLGASDVDTLQSISQLGEVESDGDYRKWYNNNPRGWCMIDFLFLELVLGRMDAVGGGYDDLRFYMSSNYSELIQSSLQKRRQLVQLSDQRC